MAKIIPVGKLPNEMLAAALADLLSDDASLFVGPGVGEDAAVLDTGEDDLVVVTADPITFSSDRIGFYAVTVNANDIATTGAHPRWFFPTLLFPVGTEETEVIRVFRDIGNAASAIGVTVSGGHTEITTSVRRPVVCGAMMGSVCKARLRSKTRIAPGDTIVMTKTAGNEGTAILARDFAGHLIKNGITRKEIAAAESFLDRLSILPEARIGAEIQSVRAMHDVTEGGVATALLELGLASGCGIEIDLDAIPIDPVTVSLCRVCGLEPLGLIGSGSLLSVLDTSCTDQYVKTLESNCIPAAPIGRVTGFGEPVAAVSKGAVADFPRFDADEITKMF